MTYNRIFFIKSHFLPALVLFLFALAACEDEPGCVSDNTNLVKIGFYQIDDTTARNADEVAITAINLIGGPSEVVNTTSSAIQLPLNPSTNTTTFEIVRASGETETVVLGYQREQQLISPDCGPEQRYFGLTIDATTFDAFRVVEPELGSITGTNIELYTCQDSFYTESVVVNFLERDTAGIRQDSLFVQSIQDDRGQVLAAENDTIVGGFRVPINPQAETTTLTLSLLAHRGEPARTETLSLSYQSDTVRFADNCRLQTRYAALDTLRSTFDSLHIENRELAVDVPLNIEIIDILE